MAMIFTIEDNPAISMVIRLALTDEGYTVIAFDNCLEAYSNLAKGVKPDVILLDLRIPGMNGKEMVKKIRGNPLLDYIPVAIITGSIPTEEILPPKGTYQALVLKPFDLRELIDTVRRLVA